MHIKPFRCHKHARNKPMTSPHSLRGTAMPTAVGRGHTAARAARGGRTAINVLCSKQPSMRYCTHRLACASDPPHMQTQLLQLLLGAHF